MTAIAADVKDAEEKEQEEAVSAAQDREAREAFEQRCRSICTTLSAQTFPYTLEMNPAQCRSSSQVEMAHILQALQIRGLF